MSEEEKGICPLSGYKCYRRDYNDGRINIHFQPYYESPNEFFEKSYSITAKAAQEYLSEYSSINKRTLWNLVAEWLFYHPEASPETHELTLCASDEKNYSENFFPVEEFILEYPSPEEIPHKILKMFYFYSGSGNLFPSIVFEDEFSELKPKLDILFIRSEIELKMLLETLETDGYIRLDELKEKFLSLKNKKFEAKKIGINATITPKGIMYAKGFIGESKKGFVAMKFGNSIDWTDRNGTCYSKEIGERDKFYDEHIVPAIEAAGFEASRVDRIDHNNKIDDEILVQIRRSRFVVCDLTYSNLGAYYEAGFAHGLGKQVFFICEKNYFESHGSHFDINHHVTILYDKANLDDFKKALASKIANNVLK